MKSTITAFLLLLCLQLTAQESKPATIQTSPSDWRLEIINLPLSFAQSIDYKGFEDIRFAPGWADTTAADYFSYTFTWYIEKNPKLNKEKLEKQMQEYFDGLMTLVAERNDLPKTQASFNFSKAKNAFGASGEITFYEAFFKQRLVTLNVDIAGSPCKATGKYLVRFNLSPQSRDHQIWKDFEQVKLKIDCEK